MGVMRMSMATRENTTTMILTMEENPMATRRATATRRSTARAPTMPLTTNTATKMTMVPRGAMEPTRLMVMKASTEDNTTSMPLRITLVDLQAMATLATLLTATTNLITATLLSTEASSMAKQQKLSLTIGDEHFFCQ